MGSALAAGDVPLVCLRDRSRLEPARGEAGLVCPTCAVAVPLRGGVLRFTDHDDPFYEGHYFGRVRYVPSREAGLPLFPLWLVKSGYVWRARRHVPAGGTLLELGCAGGVTYFGRRYRTIGADLSARSVESACDIYERCLQVDLRQGIPVPDGSLDGVVSSFFWEHIPPALKPEILSACHRALRPGGHLIFLYDVETENRFISAMKRREPERYRALFIDHDGHLGYQTPTENARIFEAAGFRIVENRGCGMTALHTAEVYEKMRRGSGWYAAVSRLALAVAGGPLRHPWSAAVHLADEAAGRFGSLSRARVLLTVCRRPP